MSQTGASQGQYFAGVSFCVSFYGVFSAGLCSCTKHGRRVVKRLALEGTALCLVREWTIFNGSENTMLSPCISLGKESYLPATAKENLGSH